MIPFRELAHLQEQLGSERFDVLLHSGNTGRVRRFCDEVILSGKLILGGRTFEVLPFLVGDEVSLDSQTLVRRADSMSACLSEADGLYILNHGAEIPEVFQRNTVFVIPGWQNPHNSQGISVIAYVWGKWGTGWHWPYDGRFDRHYRLLRPLQSSDNMKN